MAEDESTFLLFIDFHIMPHNQDITISTASDRSAPGKSQATNHSSTARARLLHEIRELHNPKNVESLANQGIRMYPGENNIFKWIVSLKGPPDTPYEGGTFYVSIEATNDYPFKPPLVSFITSISHINISGNHICLDILQKTGTSEGWSVAFTFQGIAIGLIVLLGTPNPDSPLSQELAGLYKHDYPEYFRVVQEHTFEHAAFQHDDVDLADADPKSLVCPPNHEDSKKKKHAQPNKSSDSPMSPREVIVIDD